MSKDFGHKICMWATALLCIAASVPMYAQQPAGTTADKATRVSEPTTLTVQSGSNYIRIDADHLPATVTYTPGANFGPIPEAMVMEDTLPAQHIFSDCRMVWRWVLEPAANAQIMEIRAHENAVILVEPYVCTPTKSDTTAAVCGGLEWHGKWYDASGDYDLILVNAEGCDSTRTLHLTVFPQPEDKDTTAEVWDSITWMGTTYTTSNDYTLELEDGNQCGYTSTLHLTVHYTLRDTTVESVCDSLVLGDTVYAESGFYILDTVQLESGDRQINMLDLTVRHTTYAELSEAQFDSCAAPWGTVYTASGDYTDTTTNAAGCDSITTFHLTIYTSAYDTVRIEACDSADIEGVHYTESGAYTDTIELEGGNRLIKTLLLTIGHTTYKELTEWACEEYLSPLGNTYTASGTYNEQTVNAEGCDEFITIYLTVETDCEAEYDTTYYCRGFNTPHDERISEKLIRRYVPYTFVSPADIWEQLTEGVIVSGEPTRTLVDLNRAEANIRGYYTDELTPVETIVWSQRETQAGVYTPVTVEAAPQWVNAGMLAVQIMFRCGELYNTEFPMAVDQVETVQMPVKRIMNGQVVIIRGNAVYTVTGQKIGNL